MSRGGARQGAGRKKAEGDVRHTWKIPADIEELAKENGTKWLWDAVRFKVAFDKLANR